MQLDYIITGMPRTAKAWLSNYFTVGDCYCAFEPFREGIQDKYFPDDPYQIVGASDTSAALFQDQIISQWPNVKWIIMDRPYEDVEMSIKHLGFVPKNDVYMLATKLSELRAKVNPLVIPYKELCSSLDKMEDYTGVSSTLERRKMLCDLNISVKEPRLHQSKTTIEKPVFTEKNKEYMELLWQICAPNTAAHRWITQVIECALVWDHVIDRDPIDLAMTDRVFKAFLTEWALNPFWTTNANSLLPILSSSISNWQCSYMSGMSKDRAYSIYEDVPAAVAFILGGQDRVDKFLPRLRKLVKDLRKEDDLRDGGRL